MAKKANGNPEDPMEADNLVKVDFISVGIVQVTVKRVECKRTAQQVKHEDNEEEHG